MFVKSKNTLGSIKVLLKALIKTTVVQNWDDFWSVFSWVAGQNHYQGVSQIKKMGKPLLVRKVAQLPISHQKWSFRAQGFGPWGNLGHMLKLHKHDDNNNIDDQAAWQGPISQVVRFPDPLGKWHSCQSGNQTISQGLQMLIWYLKTDQWTQF